MKAVLVLEDGTAYTGEAFGCVGEATGEVVFHTSMTGYQEILTDPSGSGQILVMTYPLIGNYGVNDEDADGARIYARGLVVHELCSSPSNWRSRGRLDAYLEEHGVMGIAGVDTRAITRRLREYGTMQGVIASADHPIEELAERAKAAVRSGHHDWVRELTTPEPYLFADGAGPRVVVVDLGAKRSTLQALARRGCRVQVVPAHATPEAVLAERPDGVLFSSGPGDPERATYAVDLARSLLGAVPIMGIGLGHQVLALAFGARTYKLKHGHRGGNHPVRDLETGRSYITTQSHGYAVAPDTLPEREVVVTHVNVHDGTVEGLRHRHWPVFSVQFRPEGGPGPSDSEFLYDRFLEMMMQSAEAHG